MCIYHNKYLFIYVYYYKTYIMMSHLQYSPPESVSTDDKNQENEPVYLNAWFLRYSKALIAVVADLGLGSVNARSDFEMALCRQSE